MRLELKKKLNDPELNKIYNFVIILNYLVLKLLISLKISKKCVLKFIKQLKYLDLF